MEEIFQHLGRLYYDVVQSQKVIEQLKTKLEEKEKELETLKQGIKTED